MIPLAEKDRLCAALAVARHLHESHVDADEIPSGAVLTPIGAEEGVVLYTVASPDGAVADTLQRTTCV
jgi:hypothetical protein